MSAPLKPAGMAADDHYVIPATAAVLGLLVIVTTSDTNMPPPVRD